jgi:hypothetical protein
MSSFRFSLLYAVLLVPIAQEWPRRAGIGKPLPVAVTRCRGREGLPVRLFGRAAITWRQPKRPVGDRAVSAEHLTTMVPCTRR